MLLWVPDTHPPCPVCFSRAIDPDRTIATTSGTSSAPWCPRRKRNRVWRTAQACSSS